MYPGIIIFVCTYNPYVIFIYARVTIIYWKYFHIEYVCISLPVIICNPK